MTHTLAATIARAIFDRIERDRTLILQNIEEVVREQLAIEGAKASEANRRVDEVIQVAIEGAKRCGDPVVSGPFPFKKIAGPEVEWGSLKNWWQAESDAYDERRRLSKPKPRVDGWYA